MADKTIQSWQRRRIYGLARELGMSTSSREKDDDLHLLAQGITGSNSLSAMDRAAADRLIAELEQRSRSARLAQRPESPGSVSEGQRRKIIALMCELRKLDAKPSTATIEQRVAGIIRRELKLTAIAQDPYVWMTYRDGVRLIEIIKGYLASAQRKGGGAG